MIKRLVWFVTGIATGAGAVVVLGKRIRRRMAELTPVRIADRGVQQVKNFGSNARQALREGVDAMRHREQELQERFNGDRSELDRDLSGESSKVIVLSDRESRRSPSKKPPVTKRTLPKL
ncbi:MAG: hypothetical protein RL119_13 [Actinomycetota bacterium]